MFRLIGSLLTLALGLFLQGCGSGESTVAPPPPLSSPVNEDWLMETGVLEPNVLKRIKSPISGRLSERQDDGSIVREGQLLFRMDDEELRNNLDSDRESLEQKEEELESTLTEWQVLTNRAEVIRNRDLAERNHAQLRLSEVTGGLKSSEKRALEIDVELAQLDLDEKVQALARQREIVERNFAPASSLLAPELEVKAAESFLQEKKTQLQLALAPPPEEQVLTLQAELDRAEETLQRRKQEQAREEHNIQLQLEGIRLELDSIRRRMEKRNREIEQVRIEAPTDGIFRVTRRYSWGSRSWVPLDIGQQLWSQDVIGEIVDPHQLTLRVLLHESEHGKLQPGQAAAAELTAYPGQSVEAKLTSISAIAMDRSDLSPISRKAPPSGQAFFLATFSLGETELPLRPGMTARIRMHLEQAE